MKSTILVFFLFTVFVFLSGCTQEQKHESPQGQAKVDSSLVRAEGTDIAALDLNGDGKLYQCPMHFKVVSDTFATCPLCKMDLEEHSIKETEDNFRK